MSIKFGDKTMYFQVDGPFSVPPSLVRQFRELRNKHNATSADREAEDLMSAKGKKLNGTFLDSERNEIADIGKMMNDLHYRAVVLTEANARAGGTAADAWQDGW